MSEQMEKSCGAVVFSRTAGGLKYVIIQSLGGYYGFPKGHCEADETETVTALREIREETGLAVSLIPGFRHVDVYPIPQKPGVMKQVVYFLAEFFDQKVYHQREELRGAYLMDYESAMDVFQWESNRILLTKANDYLSKMEINHV